MRIPKAGHAVSLVAAMSLVSVRAPEARADHPVGVALIGGGAIIIAAGVQAYGTIKAAHIAAEDGEGEGEETPPDGGDTGVGEESQSRQESTGGQTEPLDHGTINIAANLGDPVVQSSLGQSNVDSLVRPYLERSVGTRLFTPSGSGSDGLALQASYHVDSDVLVFPSTVERIVTSDRLVFTLDVEGPGKIPFRFDELKLKTHDEPGSFGYSAMWMTVEQDGALIMTWDASVSQGSMPVYDPLPNLGETVDAQSDRLNIQNLLFEIPVDYGSDNAAQLVITVYFEDSGKRT